MPNMARWCCCGAGIECPQCVGEAPASVTCTFANHVTCPCIVRAFPPGAVKFEWMPGFSDAWFNSAHTLSQTGETTPDCAYGIRYNNAFRIREYSGACATEIATNVYDLEIHWGSGGGTNSLLAFGSIGGAIPLPFGNIRIFGAVFTWPDPATQSCDSFSYGPLSNTAATSCIYSATNNILNGNAATTATITP